MPKNDGKRGANRLFFSSSAADALIRLGIPLVMLLVKKEGCPLKNIDRSI